MTARRASRWIAGIVALIGQTSCLAGPGSVAAPPAVAQTMPATSAPAAPALPDPSRAPNGAAAFALKGQLTQGGTAIGVVPAGTVSLTLDGKAVPVAADGRFLIAFDRDAAAGAMLVAARTDGTAVTAALTIAPRGWDISRLSTLPKYPVPQPEFEAKRPAEIAEINAARARVTDASGWNQTFLWPATGRISTLFGSQRIYANGEAGSYHSGLDVAIPSGTKVLAPADGVVILATDHPFTLEGNLLMIDHGMGLSSALMHLSRIDVHVGDHVKRGQPVALSGMTGRATGPHLHWGLKWQDARIDPLLLAGPMP